MNHGPTNHGPLNHTAVNNEARSRYELEVDGRVVSFAEYVIDNGTITFTHTITQAAERGQGYAAIVVRAALEDARKKNLAVRPQCWYVAEFIDANAEYADLLSA